MSAAPRISRSAAAACALVLAASACTAPPPDDPPSASSRAAFALTSADIELAEDHPLAVNLLFVAPPEDPVWHGPVSAALLDRDGEPVESGPSMEVVAVSAGDDVGRHRIGNLRVELSPEAPEATFSGIELVLAGEAEPVVRNVGSWRVTRADAARLLEPVGAYTVAYPECGRFEEVFASSGGAALEVVDVGTEAEGVEFADWSASGTGVDGDPLRLGFELECDGGADLRMLTPRVLVRDVDGREQWTTLDPLLVWLNDLDDADVERIASR